jgi:hypothetical protein
MNKHLVYKDQKTYFLENEALLKTNKKIIRL